MHAASVPRTTKDDSGDDLRRFDGGEEGYELIGVFFLCVSNHDVSIPAVNRQIVNGNGRRPAKRTKPGHSEQTSGSDEEFFFSLV